MAGRVRRHVEILRGLARELSTDPARPERPRSAAEAEERFQSHLERLNAEAPRSGLGAATGDFVDHLTKLAERYGAHLFPCFDDSRIPPNTNELEGFFGRAKHAIRRAVGCGSTTNAVVQNLGAEVLIAFHEAEARSHSLTSLPTDLDAYKRLALPSTPRRLRLAVVGPTSATFPITFAVFLAGGPRRRLSVCPSPRCLDIRIRVPKPRFLGSIDVAFVTRDMAPVRPSAFTNSPALHSIVNCPASGSPSRSLATALRSMGA